MDQKNSQEKRIASGTYVIETDHLAAPVRVLDSANSVVWSWEDREPFGGNAPTQGTVNGQPFVFNLRFPGQFYDAESGLAQNGYRDYDGTLGRYVEVDPMGLAAGMNTYGYVGGSPLTKTDSTGLVIDFDEQRPGYPKGGIPEDYKDARGFLVAYSPTAAKQFELLEKSPTHYTIHIKDPEVGSHDVSNQWGNEVL
jgi:RHS repeat-associated protein